MFKEEKGYVIRGLNIFFDCDINTIKNLNSAVHYYSFCYNVLYLYVSWNIYVFVKDMFCDDCSIFVVI
jgi:hypothetical protein